MTPQKGEDVIVHGIMDDYGVLEAVTAKAYLISFGNNKIIIIYFRKCLPRKFIAIF